MQGPSLAYLLRRAAALPPHRAVAKAAGMARRRAAALWQHRNDLAHGSHTALRSGMLWRNRVAIKGGDIAADWHAPLRILGELYRRHRFDLLGSGCVEVRYGITCRGFAGRSFPPHPAIKADRDGGWIAAHVNASNLSDARGLWRLIDDADYQPVDWQLDFRSGYRWQSKSHSSCLKIPIDVGADVKVPWELGRLQQLPQLALCALLGASGIAGFASASDYVRELRSQTLDFLALNPPRFGVNWMCPMDVGIRIANMLMAVDLLVGGGLDPGQDLIDVVLRSAYDHAIHIADHLEWSETGRSNHYLANLVGLLWAVSHLPAGGRTDALFAFAASELLREGEQQFRPDGGNYEASTNYHRLSGELVLFGVALLSGLEDDDLARLDNARADTVRLRPPWRAGPLPRYPLSNGASTVVSSTLRERLYRAALLTRAVTRLDGRVTQIGDTDSGRLFKLTPVGENAIRTDGDKPTFCEDALDHRAFSAAVSALFAVPDDLDSLDAVVLRRLAGGRTWPRPAALEVADYGDLDAIISAIASLPAECRRHRRFDFDKSIRLDAWQRAAFPNFGFYGFTTDQQFVAFRCAPPPPREAPLGHSHDDNLAVEYVLGADRRIDPGSVCYTPSREWRDLYRGASAHDVVRATDWDVAPPGADLFALKHAAWAKCLAWRPDGVAGEIAAPRGTLWRALRLSVTGLDIWDGVSAPNRLRPISPQIAVAFGYGRGGPIPLPDSIR